MIRTARIPPSPISRPLSPNNKEPAEGGLFVVDTAGREGFEPSIRFNPYNGLANRRLQPLGHLPNVGLQELTLSESMTVYSTKATQTRSRINLSASTRRPQLFGFARRRLAAPPPRPCWAENGNRPSCPPRNGSGSFARKILIAQPQQRRRLRRPAEAWAPVPL